MTQYGDPLNTDVDGRFTTSEFGNVGDGTNAWSIRTRLADGADVAQGDRSDVAVTSPAVDGTVVALLKGILGRSSGPYPPLATPVIVGSGNVANASAAATMPAVAAKTNWLCGFEVTGGGATAASIIAVTVSGLLGGSRIYDLVIPAGVTTSIVPLIVPLPFPLPASAVNVALAVTAAAFGAGNTHAAVVAHGYVL